MADISDVEEALCAQILAATYPSGVASASATGMPVKIYRGWPTSKTLNADLLAGTQTITVFSRPKSSRDTSRYPRVWRTIAQTSPGLRVEVAGTSVTFSGDAGAGQSVGLIVDGVAYAYSLLDSDTLVSTALSLAALIPSGSAKDTTITVAGARVLQARVVGSGTAEMETRRQEQGLVISVWCPTPAGRDEAASVIDTALSRLDWLQLADGSVARLLYHGTTEIDESENANLYRRNLDYTVEYPTTIRQTSAQMLFGVGILSGPGQELGFSCLLPGQPMVVPALGAIRFDAWYDPGNSIDAQCASALSPAAYQFRLPVNATISDGIASWPLATQATMDFEIAAALQAGLGFWAFDSFQPDDSLSLALQLYLTSSLRPQLKFCMIGQSSNWGEGGEDQPPLLRDITMMTQPGYMTVLGGRPLYFVLDAGADQLSGLPAGGVAAAIALIRNRVQIAGGQDPYIVWLSGAALADYSNIQAAQAAGADAAAAYSVPRLNGAPQPFSSLVTSAETDWAERIAAGFPMVPTAMTGWDQRPLVADPQPFYPLSSSLTMENYYETATAEEVADHIVSLAKFVNANKAACPAQVGLIYAWNELAEGGWLTPTYRSGGGNLDRIAGMATAISAAVAASLQPDLALIK